MTEAELAFQISESINRGWGLIQWWASVSFGLLIVPHVAADKLNFFLLFVVITLYTVFSLMVHDIVTYNFDVAHQYKSDLRVLVEAGAELTQGSKFWISPRVSSGIFMGFATTGTFICVISYLVYNFWKSMRN